MKTLAGFWTADWSGGWLPASMWRVAAGLPPLLPQCRPCSGYLVPPVWFIRINSSAPYYSCCRSHAETNVAAASTSCAWRVDTVVARRLVQLGTNSGAPVGCKGTAGGGGKMFMAILVTGTLTFICLEVCPSRERTVTSLSAAGTTPRSPGEGYRTAGNILSAPCLRMAQCSNKLGHTCPRLTSSQSAPIPLIIPS
jgi:hypothetical protein